MINHLILTRFNLQYEADDTIGISDEWLCDRMALFEEYCLPSIQKQTVQNFRWILICDIRTPDAYKAKLEHYKELVAQIEVIYTPRLEDFNPLYRQIGNTYASNNTLLLTTRLDNDDALAPTYVETAQNAAACIGDGIITFPRGRQTFVHDKRSYRVEYVSNHFTSRVEHSGFFTILGFDHTELNGFGKDVHVIYTDEPMWEEYVHGNNMLNDYLPAYKYTVTSLTDAIDITGRWLRFQANRGKHFIKRLIKLTR